MDYSVICPSKNGYYYQAPNVWYPTPSECIYMQPPELLTSCAPLIDNLKALKDSTCQASIKKMCRATYELNPPFTRTRQVKANTLTAFSNAFSNTNVVWGIIAILIGTYFARVHKDYMAFDKMEEEIDNKLWWSSKSNKRSAKVQPTDLELQQIHNDKNVDVNVIACDVSVEDKVKVDVIRAVEEEHHDDHVNGLVDSYLDDVSV